MKIHGLSCFQTANGLQAMGSGRLKLATNHTELFEFADPKLGGSEYLSANIPTVFLRKFYYNEFLAHLVGVIKKTRDKFGRVGFWGIAAMVDDDRPLQLEIIDHLFELSYYADRPSSDERSDRFEEIVSEYTEFASGDLAPYEGNLSMVFSIPGGVLSEQVLVRFKSLMEVEPVNYSTTIVQLGQVANKNLGDLDESNFMFWRQTLIDEARSTQSKLEFENLEPHVKRFIQRTDKLGVPRPESVDADFENYLIALIKYVNSSVSQRHK